MSFLLARGPSKKSVPVYLCVCMYVHVYACLCVCVCREWIGAASHAIDAINLVTNQYE